MARQQDEDLSHFRRQCELIWHLLGVRLVSVTRYRTPRILCITEISVVGRKMESSGLAWPSATLITSNANAPYAVTSSGDHVTYTDG